MTQSNKHPWILPQWPAPESVKAVSTTRQQGFSVGKYAELNLGVHVEDDAGCVARNRDYLRRQLAMPSEPAWLRQVHGNKVQLLTSTDDIKRDQLQADASVTRERAQICVAQTADCLPVLLCDTQAKVVAAAHCGWRGLCHGILKNTVAAMNKLEPDAGELMAWLGPAIGPRAFEVGEEVLQAYIEVAPENALAFNEIDSADSSRKFLADIYQLARNALQAEGVNRIYGGEYCTYSQGDLFYSYRRDGVTGRMASLIWLA